MFEFASGGDLETVMRDSSIDLSIADAEVVFEDEFGGDCVLVTKIGSYIETWKPNSLLVH